MAHTRDDTSTPKDDSRMAPSDRLKPVKRVAENRERNAARVLGDAQRVVRENETKLGQLRLFQSEYQARFRAACREGISGPQIQEYQTFLAKLAGAIAEQERTLEMSRRQSAKQKQTWQEKHTRAQAIGKAIERFRKKEVQSSERRAQQESDEFALRGVRYRK
jgi:flagellar FliJ protein